MPLKADAASDPKNLEKAPGVMTSRQDQLRFLLSYFTDQANYPLIRAQTPTAMGRLLRGVDDSADFTLRATV
ncbi:MAG TPA: hypothetical protein VK843_16310, partial [Planctomycetota bacterium]|nr:hypothetical protein [Planctomycetota bacterium]